jgi:hypothetical protein
VVVTEGVAVTVAPVAGLVPADQVYVRAPLALSWACSPKQTVAPVVVIVGVTFTSKVTVFFSAIQPLTVSLP